MTSGLPSMPLLLVFLGGSHYKGSTAHMWVRGWHECDIPKTPGHPLPAPLQAHNCYCPCKARHSKCRSHDDYLSKVRSWYATNRQAMTHLWGCLQGQASCQLAGGGG